MRGSGDMHFFVPGKYPREQDKEKSPSCFPHVEGFTSTTMRVPRSQMSEGIWIETGSTGMSSSAAKLYAPVRAYVRVFPEARAMQG